MLRKLLLVAVAPIAIIVATSSAHAQNIQPTLPSMPGQGVAAKAPDQLTDQMMPVSDAAAKAAPNAFPGYQPPVVPTAQPQAAAPVAAAQTSAQAPAVMQAPVQVPAAMIQTQAAPVPVQQGPYQVPAAAPVAVYAPTAVPVPGGAVTPPSPSDLAFQSALQQVSPMSPDQIRAFKAYLDAGQRATAEPVGTPPKPVSRSISLSLKPGETSPTLHLYPGNASVITFADATGAPWPVMSVTPGDESYKAQEAGEKGKSNMVVVTPTSSHALAKNLVVTLLNHPVPLIFTVETGVGEVDYRLDVSIQSRGPNAVRDEIMSSSLPPTNDPTVRAFLDGTPPKGARKVPTSNRDVEAWRIDDMIYVRTPLEILAPAYIARAKNVSGYNVFTMVDTPVLNVSQDGRTELVTVNR